MREGRTAGQGSMIRTGTERGTQQEPVSTGSAFAMSVGAVDGRPYRRRGDNGRVMANGSDGFGNDTESPLGPQKDPSPDAKWARTTAMAGTYTGGGSSSSSVSPPVNAILSSSTSNRVPTPTEQTPSPRRQGMSNSTRGSNPNGGGERGEFAFGFAPSGGSHGNVSGPAANAGRGGGRTPQEVGSGSTPPPWWRGFESGAGEVSRGEEGEGRGGAAAFGEELEVFSSALREDFESKLLVTARDGLKAACERERSAGLLRLEAYKRQSGEEILHLEAEERRLKAHAAALQTANGSLAAKTEVLGDRLAALHARTSSGSCVARCLCAWRGEAARVKAERSKNTTAGDHARRKLMSRTLSAWRVEVRLRINSRGRKAADQKLHAISKEIIGRYEAELSSTRAALDEAINQIAVEKARQREMEEGMRRTLLRGMSAMNMEAMRLMTEARDAGQEEFGVSGTTDGTRYSAVGTDASYAARAVGNTHHRMSEEWPRPLTPPRPAAPSAR
eukprot:g3506.t1